MAPGILKKLRENMQKQAQSAQSNVSSARMTAMSQRREILDGLPTPLKGASDGEPGPIRKMLLGDDADSSGRQASKQEFGKQPPNIAEAIQ